MENVKMNYSKLRGKIREVYGTEHAFANAMECNRGTMSARLNNLSEWKRVDIEKACRLLGIPFSDVGAYFFAERVAEAQPLGGTHYGESTEGKQG